MPWAAPLACSAPGCRVTNCAKHRRPSSSAARGYGADWRRLRAQHLAQHPLCTHPGCTVRATDVDHKLPHHGDDRLRLDPGNLRAYCHRHHSAKTAREDGAFGNGTR